jgi:hypothetical protein
MDKVNEYLKRPIIAVALGVIIGLVLGLVIGWGIWPVKYFDAAAVHLRADLQDDWVMMAVTDYKANQNAALLKTRMSELQDQQDAAIARVKEAKKSDAAFLADLDAAQKALGSAEVPVVPADSTQAPAAEPAAVGGKTNLTVLLGLMCLLTLVVGAVVAYLLLFRGKKGGASSAAPRREHQAPMSEPMVEGETPVVQYLSTYTLGSDLYDDSFSIDSATGEFLGECGVGISETIGVGDPKKVTAFEVWLFDKNDIQTVTKVLMSAHAFGDPIISQRLASKGEPVQAEPGKRISLETATLKLEARVVTMSYGSGALPANSFFDQVTLELQVFPKSA